MQLGVEISLYPLNEEYEGYILAFIERLNQDPKLFVSTTYTSTLVSGDYDHVMECMQREMKKTYAELKQAVFVCKFLNSTHMNLPN